MQSTVISSPLSYLQKTIYVETDGDVGARFIRWKEITNLQDDKKVLIFSHTNYLVSPVREDSV